MSPDRTRTGRAILSHPIVSMFLGLILIIGVPVGVALWVGHDKDVKLEAQQRAFVDYQVRQKVSVCDSQNGSRKALQTVLNRAANPPQTGASAVDFSSVNGFTELDPATRFYLVNLSLNLAGQEPSAYIQTIADDYRRDYPANQNCGALGRQTRRALEN